VGKELHWFVVFRAHRTYRDAQTVFCHEASCGSGLWGSGTCGRRSKLC
jgi:hypothetical protein